MTTLYLIRHGETVDNVAQIMQGQRQGKLTAAGMAQIEELGQSLSGIHVDAILSSDLRRAYDSAQILSRRFHLPVQTTTLLRERDWGNFTGRHIPSLKGLPMPENVESLEALLQRATDFLEWTNEHLKDKTVLAVGHGIINKAIQAVYHKKQMREIPRMDNAECRILQIDG